jgi:hypothetical protein
LPKHSDPAAQAAGSVSRTATIEACVDADAHAAKRPPARFVEGRRGRAISRKSGVAARNRSPAANFFGARKRASEPCRRAAAAAVDVAPVFARTAMRCETRSCFQGFFRERIRARGANPDIDDGIAHASTAVPPRLPRDRPGTFVLQKC